MDDLKLYGSNNNEIDSLVKVVKIVSRDIGMQFEFDKCAVLKMKRGKQVHCEGIDLGGWCKDRGARYRRIQVSFNSREW